MPYATIILAVIQIAQDLIARGRQTGELTDQQSAELLLKAMNIFGQYSQPAPPPPSPPADVAGGA